MLQFRALIGMCKTAGVSRVQQTAHRSPPIRAASPVGIKATSSSRGNNTPAAKIGR